MIDLTLMAEKLQHKKIAVFGLGKSCLSTIFSCVQADIDVYAWDDNKEKQRIARELGAEVTALDEDILKTVDVLILAPGVPLTHPKPHDVVERANKAKCEIISDIELFHRAKPSIQSIGITGTNGKSTTTALIGHILTASGRLNAVGGNIGRAVMDLPDLKKENSDIDPVYVLELSSYQLDLCIDYAPSVSVILNISPDHLDRHGGIDGYITAKKRILNHSGHAVIAIDDIYTQKMAKNLAKEYPKRNLITVSCHCNDKAGIYVDDKGLLIDNMNGSAEVIADLTKCPNLAGRHNWQNAVAAYASCRLYDVSKNDIAQGLKSFTGLDHRQKIVKTENGISYINDSKATNDDAASIALATFDNIYWIAGGIAKEGGFESCQKYLNNVNHAFLIGQDQSLIAEWLSAQNKSYTKCRTLENAVKEAHLMAEKDKNSESAILLSPACASFDQFSSFEERGDYFTKYVEKLKVNV